VEVVGE
jgi:hypothetical protein